MNKNTVATSLAFFAFLILATSASFGQTINVPYPKQGIALGDGWQSATQQSADDSCVEFQLHQEPAQTVSTTATSIHTTEDFFDKTNTNMGFEAQNIIGVSASLRSSFMDSITVHSERQNYLVLSKVENSVQTATHPDKGPLRIKDTYVTLLSQPNGVAKFLQTCGDSFVSVDTEAPNLSALRRSKSSRVKKRTIQV